MKAAEQASIACIVVGPISTNCYVLSCPRTSRAIIIDPGGDPEIIAEYVSRTKLAPIEIMSTHGHSDHIAAVADLKDKYDIPYAVHEADLKIIKRSVQEAPLWGMGRIREPKVDRLLAPGEDVVFGEVRGNILHTPGHTPGGISLLFDGFVVVGDTLFNRSIGRTDFYGGDLETLLSSIREKLFTLPDETVVCCGHGPRTTIGVERSENPFLAERP
jgi:hydroxyacylglutathione hydrolase